MKTGRKILIIGVAAVVLTIFSMNLFAHDAGNITGGMTSNGNAKVTQKITFRDNYNGSNDQIVGNVECNEPSRVGGRYAFMDYIYQDATIWGGGFKSKQVSNIWHASLTVDGPSNCTGGQYGVYMTDAVYGTWGSKYVTVSH